MKRKQETARNVRSGLESAIEATPLAAGFKPNVWFSDPWMVKVGKIADGAPPDARPTDSTRYLGRLDTTGDMDWDEEAVIEVFGPLMTGKRILRLGMERTRF